MKKVALVCLKLLIAFSFAYTSECAFAQCNIVSGNSGEVYTGNNADTLSYTVSLTPGASLVNLGWFTACGLTFPGIDAPWSGNSNIIDTVTYTFSAPIYGIDVFVAYVGVNTLIQPETFTFDTDTSIPSITVNSGLCSAWTVSGNQTTSPSIFDGVNAIVTVASPVPFTQLKITSGLNSSSNGGSSYGLCNTSVVITGMETPEIYHTVNVYPNPASEEFNVELGQDVNHISLKLFDMCGKLVIDKNEHNTKKFTVNVSSLPAGIYISEMNVGGSAMRKKLVKE